MSKHYLQHCITPFPIVPPPHDKDCKAPVVASLLDSSVVDASAKTISYSAGSPSGFPSGGQYYFGEEGLTLMNGARLDLTRSGSKTFAMNPLTVSFQWRSRVHVAYDGSLSFSGVIAETPIGDIKVATGPKGMSITLEADQNYSLATV